MAGHSHKSPSQAKRIHACAGALPLVDSLPPEQRVGAGRPAQMGTAAHHLLEKCLSSLTDPEVYLGRIIKLIVDKDGDATGCSMLKVGAKTPPLGDIWFEVDEVMVEGVQLAYFYTLKRCEALGIDPKKLLLEQRTNPVPDRDDTAGTADVTLDAWPELEVIDYKNGYVIVEHEDNEQLLAYLAGRAHDTGWCHEEYKITVVQPNSFHDEGKVRTFEISKEDLLAFVDKHRAACERADRAADEFSGVLTPEWTEKWLVAGPHCQATMCDARLTCPALKAWNKAQAGKDFDDDPAGVNEVPTITALGEAAKVLAWAPYLTAHIKAARQFANDMIRSGVTTSELKLVRSRGKRAFRKDIGEPHTIAANMVKAGIISDNERALLFTEPELITGPKAEKLIKGKGAGVRKQKFADEFLTFVPGGLKVVLASAPGEAVTANPGEDFDDDGDDYD